MDNYGQCDVLPGSDKPLVVADKHVVNSGPMKPPFPAGTELAMFGQASLCLFAVHSYCLSCAVEFCTGVGAGAVKSRRRTVRGPRECEERPPFIPRECRERD